MSIPQILLLAAAVLCLIFGLYFLFKAEKVGKSGEDLGPKRQQLHKLVVYLLLLGVFFALLFAGMPTFLPLLFK